MYGRFANGENGQGIAIKMIISERLNQTNIVLYLSLSVFFRFAKAEPIVTNTTESIISRI